MQVYNAAVPELSAGMPKICEIQLTGEHPDEKPEILGVEYCAEFQLLIMCASDFTIRFFDASPLIPRREYYESLIAVERLAVQAVRGEGYAGQTGEKVDALGRVVLDDPPELEEVLHSLTCNIEQVHSHHVSTPQHYMLWVGDKRELLTCGVEPVVYRWSVSSTPARWTGKAVRMQPLGLLEGHDASVTALTMIPLSNPLTRYDHLLGIGGDAGAPPGSRLQRHRDHGSKSVLPDLVATVGSDKRLCVWRWSERGVVKLTDRVEHQQGLLHCVHIPHSNMLATGGHDQYIQLWDLGLDDGSPMMRLEGHHNGVVAMAAVAGKDQLMSVDSTGLIRWWNCSKDINIGPRERLLQLIRPAMAAGASFVCRDLTPIPSIRDMRLWALGAAVGPLGQRQGRGDEVICAADFSENVDALLEGMGTRAKALLLECERGFVDEEHLDDDAAVVQTSVACGAMLATGPRFKLLELMKLLDTRSDPAAALYSDITCEVYVAVDGDLKVFDAATGEPLRLYSNVLGSHIQSMALDGRGRKLCVATAAGRATVLNAYTGCMILDAHEFEGEVAGALSCWQDNVIISAGANGVLKFTDELFEADADHGGELDLNDLSTALGQQGVSHAAAEAVGVTEINMGDGAGGTPASTLRSVADAHDGRRISTLGFDYERSFVLTGCDAGRVRLWDYQTVAFCGEGSVHGSSVVFAGFVPGYRAAITVDGAGCFVLWELPEQRVPALYLTPLAAWHTPCLTPSQSAAPASTPEQGEPVSTAVFVSLASDQAKILLVAGTDSGHVLVYDIQRMLDRVAGALRNPAVVPSQEGYTSRLRTAMVRTGSRAAPSPDAPPQAISHDMKVAGGVVHLVRSVQLQKGMSVRSLSIAQPTGSTVLLVTDSGGMLTIWDVDKLVSDGSARDGSLGGFHTAVATAMAPDPAKWRFPVDQHQRYKEQMQSASELYDAAKEQAEADAEERAEQEAMEAEQAELRGGAQDSDESLPGSEVLRMVHESKLGTKVSRMASHMEECDSDGEDQDQLEMFERRKAAVLAAGRRRRAGAIELAGVAAEPEESQTAHGLQRRKVFAQVLLDAVTWRESAEELHKRELRQQRELKLAQLHSSLQLRSDSKLGPSMSRGSLALAASATAAQPSHESLTARNLASVEAVAADQTGADGAGEQSVRSLMSMVAMRRRADDKTSKQYAKFDGLLGARVGTANTTRQALAHATTKAARARGLIDMSDQVPAMSPRREHESFPALCAERARVQAARARHAKLRAELIRRQDALLASAEPTKQTASPATAKHMMPTIVSSAAASSAPGSSRLSRAGASSMHSPMAQSPVSSVRSLASHTIMPGHLEITPVRSSRASHVPGAEDLDAFQDLPSPARIKAAQSTLCSLTTLYADSNQSLKHDRLALKRAELGRRAYSAMSVKAMLEQAAGGSSSTVYLSVPAESLQKLGHDIADMEHRRTAALRAPQGQSRVEQNMLGLAKAQDSKPLTLEEVQDRAAKARSGVMTVSEISTRREQGVQDLRRMLRDAHIMGEASSMTGSRLDPSTLAKRKRFGPYLKHEVDAVKDLFQALDEDNSGTVELHEIRQSTLLAAQPQLRRHIEVAFEKADEDKSGNLTLDEFAGIMFPGADKRTLEEIGAWMCVLQAQMPPPVKPKSHMPQSLVDDLKKLFKLLDTNNDKSVDLQELQEGIAEARRQYKLAEFESRRRRHEPAPHLEAALGVPRQTHFSSKSQMSAADIEDSFKAMQRKLAADNLRDTEGSENRSLTLPEFVQYLGPRFGRPTEFTHAQRRAAAMLGHRFASLKID